MVSTLKRQQTHTRLLQISLCMLRPGHIWASGATRATDPTQARCFWLTAQHQDDHAIGQTESRNAQHEKSHCGTGAPLPFAPLGRCLLLRDQGQGTDADQGDGIGQHIRPGYCVAEGRRVRNVVLWLGQAWSEEAKDLIGQGRRHRLAGVHHRSSATIWHLLLCSSFLGRTCFLEEISVARGSCYLTTWSKPYVYVYFPTWKPRILILFVLGALGI